MENVKNTSRERETKMEKKRLLYFVRKLRVHCRDVFEKRRNIFNWKIFPERIPARTYISR